MSSAITTVISSGGPIIQNFATPQTLSEDGISVIQSQQPATMIPIPSVTLRTLVLDLLGKATRSFNTNTSFVITVYSVT